MQRYFALEKRQNRFIVTKEDEHHIINVMRFKVNDLVEIVYLNQLFEAKITKEDPLTIDLIKEILINKNKNFYVRIIIPFLKEAKMDFILQKATELGVDEICLVEMDRSIIKYDFTKLEKKLQRWFKICKEASEQAKRITIPKVLKIEKQFHFEGLNLICEPTANETYNMYLKKLKQYDKINLLIGPEGGFTKKELEYYITKGFIPVKLIDNIMRVETVPLFLLSIISYEKME